MNRDIFIPIYNALCLTVILGAILVGLGMTIVWLIKVIKRAFCKHHFETYTNISGDAINHFRGARSISECIYCGKTKYGKLDPNCHEINKF